MKVERSDILDLIAQDADAVGVTMPKSEDLNTLARFADEITDLEAEIERLEGELAEKQKRLNDVQRKHLPDMMTGLRMTSFALTDGSSIEVVAGYDAHISAERALGAHKWLRDNGHGDIIKNTFSIQLGRGDDEKAAELIKLLGEKGIGFERKEAVHPMTLKGFVREQIEAQAPLDREALGVHEYSVAKVKRPKPKKVKKEKR